MISEHLPQAELKETYNQNHAELIDYMGWLQAAITSNYRNEQPRSSEHIGKQEELKAMLLAVLEFARSNV